MFLYKLVAGLASRENPDWQEREYIEMALKFIKWLEDFHETERRTEEYERKQRRREQAKKKKANVVKLVDGNASPSNINDRLSGTERGMV